MRPLLAALERGDLVALPLDGGSFRSGIPVKLLGRALRMAPGAARLACLSGRPILPVFARRTGFLEQEVSIGAPLWPTPIGRAAPGGPEQTARGHSASGLSRGTARLAQQAADLLGAHLRRTPGEWCIFRPLERAGEAAPQG